MIRANSYSRDSRWVLSFLSNILAVLCVLLFTRLGYSAQKPAAGALEPPRAGRLVLVWMGPNQLFPWGQKRVAQEAQAVLADAGIEVCWRVYGAPDDLSPRSGEKSTVAIFLTPMDASTWGLENNAMGAVVKSGKNPMVYVFFPNIKRAMGYSPEEKVNRSPQDIYRFANALGRIIAHEVMHVCFPEMPHTHDGLMAGRWNLKNLEYARPRNVK